MTDAQQKFLARVNAAWAKLGKGVDPAVMCSTSCAMTAIWAVECKGLEPEVDKYAHLGITPKFGLGVMAGWDNAQNRGCFNIKDPRDLFDRMADEEWRSGYEVGKQAYEELVTNA